MYLKLNASYYMQQKSEIRILDVMALGQGGGWGGGMVLAHGNAYLRNSLPDPLS